MKAPQMLLPGEVHPVRNSSGALAALSRRRSGLNPSGIIIKPDSAAKQRGIISNGVNIISYHALGSAPAGQSEMAEDLDFKMKSEVTALL